MNRKIFALFLILMLGFGYSALIKNQNGVDASRVFGHFYLIGASCLYFNPSLATVNMTFISSQAAFEVYNVSNISYPEGILGDSYFDDTSTAYYQTSYPSTGYYSFNYNTGGSTYFEFYYQLIPVAGNLSAQGKVNSVYFYADIPYNKNFTLNDQLQVEYYCQSKPAVEYYGSNLFTGVIGVDYTNNYFSMINRIRDPNENIYLTVGNITVLKALTPYNLNDFVYVRNRGGYIVAIYAVYNGTDYLLTGGELPDISGFYTDTALLHKVQCGSNNYINLSSSKKNVLIKVDSGNLILDLDSTCSQLVGGENPEVNDTLGNVFSTIYANSLCGNVDIQENKTANNVSFVVNFSYPNTTYKIIEILSNGTQNNYIYGGDFNATFNLLNVDYLALVCTGYKPDVLSGVEGFEGVSISDLEFEIPIFTYKPDFGGLRAVTPFGELAWIFFFVGLFSLMFLVGRNHLSIFISIAFFVILYAVLMNILGSFWIILLIVAVIFLMLVTWKWL